MASPHELKLLFERGDFSHFARTNVSALAKDFIKRLLCTNPQRRLTATQAMKHPWLSRLADDLNDLYERSTENWKGRIGTVTIDSFVKPGFGAPPGPVRVPSIIYEEPVPSNTEYNTENEEVEISNLESSGTKEAYDNVAGDGKLRTAAQLAQKANDKRAIITKANPQKVITLGPKRKRDMVETVTRNKMSFLRLDSGEKSQYFSNLSRG
jgi:serine/threonine protein kinase